MKIKNMVWALALLCACACLAEAAPGKAAKKGAEEISFTEAALAQDSARAKKNKKERKEKTTKKEARQLAKGVDLKAVQKYYANGDLDYAETELNTMLASNPYNTEALELKNKILIVRDRLSVFKKTLAEGYSIEAERATRDGNFFEALYFLKKSDELFPENRDEAKIQAVETELNNYAKTFGRYDKKFLRAVDYFVKGKFSRSARLISDLAEYYPKMDRFVGMGMYNEMLETNIKRVKRYYNTAFRSFKKGRFDKARNELDFAVALDPDNLKVRLLSEQINVELS